MNPDPNAHAEMQSLLDEIINREDVLKVTRTQQSVAKKKLTRLAKRYPTIVQQLASSFEDAGIRTGDPEGTEE